MKLKKYEASTEQEAMENIKEELGADALILNIKKIKPKGLFATFRKTRVEVTAAYEEKPLKNVEAEKKNTAEIDKLIKSETEKEEIKIKELEKKLKATESMLESAMNRLNVKEETNKYNNETLQEIYNRLSEQGVQSETINEIFEEFVNIEDIDNLDINIIVKIVYNKIIKMIGTPTELTANEDEKFAKNVVFIGPTGVGKTTTIAKLSSMFIINEGAEVGFITCDTYRIAAVEQLKTYAEILGCDVGVVYAADDLKETIENMRVVNSMLFIDTAGRSHKNKENFDEIEEIINAVETKDIYLVLSITTKYEDLINIINAYSKITDFKIILTKIDETSSLGAILNIRHETGKEISYLSHGQNVPDDFEIVTPEKITKAILGSMYE